MYRKLTVINFSHPLTPKVLKQVFEHENINALVIGLPAYTEIEQKVFPCQIDLEQPVEPQMLNIIRKAFPDPTLEQDIILAPPSLAIAAYLVARRFMGYPKAIWLKRDEITSEWVLGGIE